MMMCFLYGMNQKQSFSDLVSSGQSEGKLLSEGSELAVDDTSGGWDSSSLVVSGGSSGGVISSGLFTLSVSVSSVGLEVLESLSGVLVSGFGSLDGILNAVKLNGQVGQDDVGVLEGDR